MAHSYFLYPKLLWSLWGQIFSDHVDRNVIKPRWTVSSLRDIFWSELYINPSIFFEEVAAPSITLHVPMMRPLLSDELIMHIMLNDTGSVRQKFSYEYGNEYEEGRTISLFLSLWCILSQKYGTYTITSVRETHEPKIPAWHVVMNIQGHIMTGQIIQFFSCWPCSCTSRSNNSPDKLLIGMYRKALEFLAPIHSTTSHFYAIQFDIFLIAQQRQL